MTPEEAKWYAKGYAARAKGMWPAHKPPAPPDARIAGLLKAAIALRDATAAGCGTFSEDDEFVLALNPPIDALDAELERWTAWLTARDDAAPADSQNGRTD